MRDLILNPFTLVVVGGLVFWGFIGTIIYLGIAEDRAMEQRCYEARGFWHGEERLCTKPDALIDVGGSR